MRWVISLVVLHPKPHPHPLEHHLLHQHPHWYHQECQGYRVPKITKFCKFSCRLESFLSNFLFTESAPGDVRGKPHIRVPEPGGNLTEVWSHGGGVYGVWLSSVLCMPVLCSVFCPPHPILSKCSLLTEQMFSPYLRQCPSRHNTHYNNRDW